MGLIIKIAWLICSKLKSLILNRPMNQPHETAEVLEVDVPMLNRLGAQWESLGFCAWCQLKFSSHHSIESHYYSARAVTLQASFSTLSISAPLTRHAKTRGIASSVSRSRTGTHIQQAGLRTAATKVVTFQQDANTKKGACLALATKSSDHCVKLTLNNRLSALSRTWTQPAASRFSGRDYTLK